MSDPIRPQSQWYDNLQTLHSFAEWLVDDLAGVTVTTLLDLMEKPWHWQPEYDRWQAETSVTTKEGPK